MLAYGALIVGDLHIGLEGSLEKGGLHLPSQTQSMLSGLLGLLHQTRAKRLFLLGDIKHTIGRVSPQEAREIPHFLSALSAEVQLAVILGNHDGGLKPLLKGIDSYGPRGLVYKKLLLFHGNAKPRSDDISASSQLIASHWHPMVEFRDAAGALTKEKAWIEAEAFGKPLLIIPSFNSLLGGIPFTKISESWVDLSHARATLLDGTYLGEHHGQDLSGKAKGKGQQSPLHKARGANKVREESA